MASKEILVPKPYQVVPTGDWAFQKCSAAEAWLDHSISAKDHGPLGSNSRFRMYGSGVNLEKINDCVLLISLTIRVLG